MYRYFVDFWESVRIAFVAIRVNKMRTILTSLGIIIGIASVTAMVTVINGLEREFDSQLSSLGTDVLYVEKWPWIVTGSDWWQYINRPDVRPELADYVNQRARFATAAAPVISTRRTIGYGANSVTGVAIEASTSDYERVYEVDLDDGRFYNELDDRAARRVIVLGHRIAEELFPQETPIGKHVRVGGHRFEVIGVLIRKGSAAGGDASEDNQVKIPISTFSNLFGMQRRSVSVRVKAISPDHIDLAEDELTGLMRAARGIDAMAPNDFEINQQDSFRRQLAPIKTAIYGIGIFLTALSLLVGGIGVMNIMYVSVKERTREIGIRKAIGAPRRAILQQFLVEAVVVCLIGGVIGIALSALLALLISAFMPTVLPASTIALAFMICVGIGVLFGLAPAWSAARSEPIESLRYE